MHLLQTKMSCKTAGHLFHNRTSPMYLLRTPCVQDISLDPTLFPHVPQGCILLNAISPSVPLTIILVFRTFTFNPLPSNALFHLWDLYLKSFKLSLSSTRSSAYKISTTISENTNLSENYSTTPSQSTPDVPNGYDKVKLVETLFKASFSVGLSFLTRHYRGKSFSLCLLAASYDRDNDASVNLA